MLKKDSAKDFYGVYRNHILYDLTSCRRLTWTFQHPLVSKSTYLMIIILQWVKGSHLQMCTHHFKIHNSRVGGSRAATLLYAPTKYSPHKIQCAHIVMIELYLIGASLTEPHINGTALRELFVYIYICIYVYIYMYIYMVRRSYSVYKLF